MKKLPPLGLRIIKSSFGVLCGFLIFYLRGQRGAPFYTALAVLWCMRSNIQDSFHMAKQRTIGTIIGGIYGFLVIIIVRYFHVSYFLNLTMISLMIIPIIYTTLLIHKKNASYFACVVFLSIVVNHIGDENPYLFVFNRVLDTLIGIFISLIINQMHIPRHKNKDILFVSGIDDVLVDSYHHMSDYSLRSINCMIDDGMLFTVSSLNTVATILDYIGNIHFNLPIITMDGAALFDIEKKRYLKTFDMDYDRASFCISFIESLGFHVFVNSIFEDSWIIHYNDFHNDVEKSIFESLRVNPYRNYYKHPLMKNEKTIYLMIVDQNERIEYLYQKMLDSLNISLLKILKYESKDYPGYSYMKIYDSNATRENMLKELMNMYHIEKCVTFGSIEGKYDILIDHDDPNIFAKKLDQLYQPFFFLK